MSRLNVYLVLGFLLSFLPRIEASVSLHSFSGKAQGTSYHVSFRAESSPRLAEEVASFLADFDKTFSNYRPDSEVSRFNTMALKGEWFPVSESLYQLVVLAQKISERTGGIFDITLGAQLKLWGFGPYRKAIHELPSPAALKNALLQSGYQNLKIRAEPRALQKGVDGLEIDLSGIGQGYAVDRVAAILDAKGIHDYLVEIGGELLTKGQKEIGVDWQISIDSPPTSESKIATVISPRGQAVATSGSYRNYFEMKGKHYAHILDPRSAQASEKALASASVLAHSAAEADALAKVLMVLGPEKARLWAEKERIASFLIIPHGNGFRTESLAGFQKFQSRGL